MIRIEWGTIEGLGFDLDLAITAYQVALAQHASTVDVPAPVAAPAVEYIVSHGGTYEPYDAVVISSAAFAANGSIVAQAGGETFECPNDKSNAARRVVARWEAAGGVIAPYVVPPLDGTSVDAERDRRLALGTTVTLSTGKVIPVQTRDINDARNLLALHDLALYLAATNSAQTIPFRDATNTTWNLTAAEQIEMNVKVTLAGSAIFQKSWAIKALPQVPANYTDDSFWK